MSEEQIKAIMALVDRYGEECARVEYFTQCDQLSAGHEAAKHDARDAVLAALQENRDV
jgi:hypothetical protein